MLSVILLLVCVREKLKMDKYENCTVQSGDVLIIEQRYSDIADKSLKLIFNDTVVSSFPSETRWTSFVPNVYLYSSFLEVCPLEVSTPVQFCVKFVGIVLSNSSSLSPFLSALKCAIKNNSSITKKEFAVIELLPESHSKAYTSAFLFCPLQNVEVTHASLYHGKSFNLTWLPVTNNLLPPIAKVNIFNQNTYDIKFSQGISLCVRPLFGNFTIVSFSEFIAYYSVMGIDHFIFYFLESFKPLNIFLQYLKFSNISHNVHLWNIPLTNDLIHEYGQIAFTQDCIARSENKFSHTIIVDFDEYIVPQVHKDIKNLVLHLDNENPFAGSYLIPMVLFCYEYQIEKMHVSPFHILNHNKRQNTHWPHTERSKCILKPDRIRIGGIHYTWKLEKHYKEVYVSPKVALLNHYKKCCGMIQPWFFNLLEFKVLNDETVIDDTLKKHSTEFMNNNLTKFISQILFKNIL